MSNILSNLKPHINSMPCPAVLPLCLVEIMDGLLFFDNGLYDPEA